MEVNVRNKNSSEENDVTSTLDKYTAGGLLCSNCYERCSSAPKILMCMHTFCDRCESSYTDIKLSGGDFRKCPICTRSVASTSPENTALVRLPSNDSDLQISPRDVGFVNMTSQTLFRGSKTHPNKPNAQIKQAHVNIDKQFKKPKITNIIVTRSFDDSAKIKISWEACPSAYLYRTKFSNTEGNVAFLKEITFQQLKDPGATSVVIDGLRHNCNYCICLQAVYPEGMSNFGEKMNILTPHRVNRTSCFLSIDSKAMLIYVDAQTQTCASNSSHWSDDGTKRYDFYDKGRLLKLRGVTSNRWFGGNACEYWEVAVTLRVKQKPRATVDLFSLGVVQEDKRDEFTSLSYNIFSAGCALYRVAYKSSLALRWWNGGQSQAVADNKELVSLHDVFNKTKTVTFGFLLDMRASTLYVVNVGSNELLQIVMNVKPTKCLPVFELLEDKTADVEVKYVTGDSIVRLPPILSGDN